MPAKSQKQKRFMAAVANNPKFANKVGVPQSVGEEFMKKSKNYMGGGMMEPYAESDMIDIGGVGGAPGDEITRGIPMDYDDTPRPKPKPKPKPPAKKKKPVKKMGGGKIKGYKNGGKVRGCGKAMKGVRPAKMVAMKGA